MHHQVGASNELPESEELDALYDRFLLRRKVEQVSSYGLSELLADANLGRAAFHSSQEKDASGSTLQAVTGSSEQILDLSQDLFRRIRSNIPLLTALSPSMTWLNILKQSLCVMYA